MILKYQQILRIITIIHIHIYIYIYVYIYIYMNYLEIIRMIKNYTDYIYIYT